MDDESEESKKEGRVKPLEKVPSKFQPLNKNQQVSDKAAGFITGYFKLSKGRPPKQEDSRPERKPLYKNLKSTPSSKSKKGKKRNAKGSNEKKKQKAKGRGTYTNWALPENRDALDAAVLAKINQEDPQAAASKVNPLISIPRGTLNREVNLELKRREMLLEAEDHHEDDYDIFDPKAEELTSRSLTNQKFRDLLQSIINSCDDRNDGMGQKDVITTIADLHNVTFKTYAENHYNYLVRNKKLPNLERGGRIVTAEAATTT